MKRKDRKVSRRALVCFDETKLEDLDPFEITEEDRAIYGTLLLYPGHDGFPKQYPKTDHCSQAEFARIFAISQTRVSQLVSQHILTPAMPWRIWYVQFIAYSRGVAAGRSGTGIFVT